MIHRLNRVLLQECRIITKKIDRPKTALRSDPILLNLVAVIYFDGVR